MWMIDGIIVVATEILEEIFKSKNVPSNIKMILKVILSVLLVGLFSVIIWCGIKTKSGILIVLGGVFLFGVISIMVMKSFRR